MSYHIHFHTFSHTIALLYPGASGAHVLCYAGYYHFNSSK